MESEIPIRSHPEVMGGDDCVGEARIPVWILVSMRIQGEEDDAILNSYPDLSATDLQCAWHHYERDPHRIVTQRARHFETPALLTDATIPSALVDAFWTFGLDVATLSEPMREVAVLRHASALGRALVTEYGSVFKRLHQESGGNHAGIVLVPTDEPAAFVAKEVARAAFEERIGASYVLKINRPFKP